MRKGRLFGGLGDGCLQTMEIIHGALRMGGGGKDGALVLFQDFEPATDIGSVIVTDLRGDTKIGAEESGTEFGKEMGVQDAQHSAEWAWKARSS